jgi:ADP-ribosylglycohydrolase
LGCPHPPIADYEHGTWNQPAGTITDDTDQALCFAWSLVDQNGFDPADIAYRFVVWYDSGPFDIGNMTRRSIQALKRGQTWDQAGQQVWEASPEGSNAGNESVMWYLPLALVLDCFLHASYIYVLGGLFTAPDTERKARINDSSEPV